MNEVTINKELDITSCQNTDKEIWRKVKGDYYSPSIHITQEGNVGINVGGFVIVMSIEDWHRKGRAFQFWEMIESKHPIWKHKLIRWLLK